MTEHHQRAKPWSRPLSPLNWIIPSPSNSSLGFYPCPYNLLFLDQPVAFFKYRQIVSLLCSNSLMLYHLVPSGSLTRPTSCYCSADYYLCELCPSLPIHRITPSMLPPQSLSTVHLCYQSFKRQTSSELWVLRSSKKQKRLGRTRNRLLGHQQQHSLRSSSERTLLWVEGVAGLRGFGIAVIHG